MIDPTGREVNFDSYFDPPDEEEGCSICYKLVDDCICPECKACGEVGNPDCYIQTGKCKMTLNDEQKGNRLIFDTKEITMTQVKEEGYKLYELLERVHQLLATHGDYGQTNIKVRGEKFHRTDNECLRVNFHLTPGSEHLNDHS